MPRTEAILVLDIDTPPGISGAASQTPGVSCALVNRRDSLGRRNFDLAHELFHLLTWAALDTGRLSVKRAASLLELPSPDLASLLDGYGHET